MAVALVGSLGADTGALATNTAANPAWGTGDCTQSETSVTQGDTVTTQATIKNAGGTSIALPNMILAGRPPGGTNGGGPFDDFSPTGTNITLAPGQSHTQNAPRSFTTNDPTGGWYCFATYET